jgi:arylsulfatase A-like enzyme
MEETMTHLYGAFPKEEEANPTRNDWTAEALIDPLWADGVPDFTLLWLNQPDAAQHQTGPGSKASLEGIRNSDQNLARVLKALEAKGARETTDVLVVSDHGVSTISSRIDIAKELQDAGLNATREFKTKPARGEVLVVSNSGTTTIYVIGHDEGVIQKTVNALQRSRFSGVIFTRKGLPGTFALSQAHLDSDLAADVIATSRWTPEKNENGTPGMIMVDIASTVTKGSHVSLSPYDMHATLIAAGPDFRSGVVDDLPSGNVDIAPTVLWILGIKPPKPMDGRVLAEALTIKSPPLRAYEPRRIEATCENHGVVWRQYLNVTEVNGVQYLDEGNGELAPVPKR